MQTTLYLKLSQKVCVYFCRGCSAGWHCVGARTQRSAQTWQPGEYLCCRDCVDLLLVICGDVLLQLDAEAGLVDAVPSLCLGFVFNFLCFSFSSSLVVFLFAIIQANVSEVSCDAGAALIIFGWAVTAPADPACP